MKKGKFIVLYGTNNLGKTVQVKMLVDNLVKRGEKVVSFKYALYDLKPTGPLLYDYLKKGNPHNLSAREFQTIQALNRTQFDAEIKKFLDEGTWVVAEDYSGTSIAWGVGAGIDREFLINLNSHLTNPDISILLDGDRFVGSIEKNHKHETDDDLTTKVRHIHLDLAKEYDWHVVSANQAKEKVHQDIVSKISV